MLVWALNDEAYNITHLKEVDHLLSVAVGYSSFQPGKGLEIEMDFVPANKLAGNNSTPEVPGASIIGQTSFHLISSPAVCLTYFDNDLHFDAFEAMASEYANVGLYGDVNWYPFDTFTGELFMYAHTASSEDNATCSEPLPILPAVFGAVQGFSIDAKVTPGSVGDVDYSYVLVKLTARRTAVSIGFAVLIFITMWMLTAMVVLTAAWVWITGRRVELPLVAISTALLYALPNIRRSQPGVPADAGIISDLVGYIWNIILVSLSVIALMANYIIRKDGGKQPKAKTT
ncbi:hypothetical protein C8J56DRAFT_47334 [Mycena floridula]|nr:hypothetical protein C8J56DRAFT_406557 [Mycena floridula]KAJ7588490.1 hypothetical protein C8J56DRAFT_47334 [Mycena floridula]